MIYSQYVLTKDEKYIVSAVLLAVLFIVGNLFFKSMSVIFLYPALIRKSEGIYSTFMKEKRKKKLLLQYRDLLYELSSSFVTGMHMEEAVREATGKLSVIYGNDSDIVTELQLMTEKMNKGETDIEVWEDFSERCGLEDVRDFVMVFRVCRETGGNFISVINQAAGLIGEKIILENEIATMMVQKKYEGNIIAIMPFVIILFLRFSSPGYLSPVYNTVSGRIIMMFSLVLTGFSYAVIRRIVQVEI